LIITINHPSMPSILGSREAEPQVLDAGTPPPITAVLSFLDAEEQPLQKASIGDPIFLVVSSEQAGPHNMMLTECTATRVGGEGEAVPFTIIDNGLVDWGRGDGGKMIDLSLSAAPGTRPCAARWSRTLTRIGCAPT
jgi:hypothetical protein